jgi:hypothetical protein
MAAFAHPHQRPERQAAMTQVKTQLPALAALVDFWWHGVRQDLEHAAVSPIWQQWAQEALLPWRYGAHQGTRTRCARRKAKLQQILERVRVEFETHTITRCLPPQA